MNKKFFKLIPVSIFLIVFSVATTYLASFYIHKTFTVPPVVRDLLWEKLPYLNIMWLSEIFMISSVIFVLIWSFKKNQNYFHYAIFMWTIFHFLRAGLIILTPLGFPQGYSGFLQAGSKSVFQYGAFPSGHLSIPYLAFMLTKKKIVLLATFVVGFCLVLSHSHYSIDIIGTLLLAYPIFKFSEKYARRYFEDGKSV